MERTEHTWQSEQCILCNDIQSHPFDFNIDEYKQENNIQKHAHLTPTSNLPVELYDEAYENLSAKDINREFIRWHYRLGHISFKKMKLLSVLGELPRKFQECSPPACAVCIYGGMTKRPWRSKPLKLPRSTKMPIANPGQCVSIDQMEVREEGFIAQLKGKLTKQRYKYATVFVDQFTGLSYAHLQRSLTSTETVEGKLAFEAYARSMGVRICAYHADNGRFADNLFLKSVETAGQTITFCGVGAHHQNGRAEKKIRDLRESARKMLLHSMARWPQAVTIHLWPYALRNATNMSNMVPDSLDGSCKLERFANVPISPRLKNFHTFGCPVYALKSDLQNNNGTTSKFDARARLGVNLGLSPRHARNVSLILSLDTGLVSPQFHIIHDEFFETVKPNAGNDHIVSRWQYLSGIKRLGRVKRIQGANTTSANLNQTNDPPSKQDLEQSNIPQSEIIHNSTKDVEANDPIDPSKPNAGSYYNDDGHRRSSRLKSESSLLSSEGDYERYYDALHEEDFKLQDDMQNPISFVATSNKDTMYWHQAMKQPDAEEFRKAAIKEFNDHCERKHWVLIERSQVPKGRNVLPAVWAMKRKRDILTGKITKYKARFNVHGGKQIR